jgi:clan AA aspartic protease (TIGR02281 family)
MSNALCKNAIPPNGYLNEDYSIMFRSDDRGHFIINVLISGKYTEFLLDTGASSVSLTYKDAARLGIDVDGLLYIDPVETANGKSYVAPITIDSLTIGPITVKKIKGHVSKDNKGQSLLGMDFLRQLKRFTIEDGCLTMWGKDGAPREDKKEEEVKPPKAPNASQRKPTPTKPSTDNQCVRDLKRATDRIQAAEETIGLARIRIAISKTQDLKAALKSCKASLVNAKNDKFTCYTTYTDALDSAATCQAKLPNQQANTYKLITGVVTSLNKAFEAKKCTSLKRERTFLSYTNAAGKPEGVITTRGGKLVFVGDRVFIGKATPKCEERLKEAAAKAVELEKLVATLQADASKADPDEKFTKLAACKFEVEAAKNGLKKCREDGESSMSVGPRCNKELEAFARLEKTLVRQVNELVDGGCALPAKTELASNGVMRMWVGQDGKVVLAGVVQGDSDEL